MLASASVSLLAKVVPMHSVAEFHPFWEGLTAMSSWCAGRGESLGVLLFCQTLPRPPQAQLWQAMYLRPRLLPSTASGSGAGS